MTRLMQVALVTLTFLPYSTSSNITANSVRESLACWKLALKSHCPFLKLYLASKYNQSIKNAKPAMPMTKLKPGHKHQAHWSHTTDGWTITSPTHKLWLDATACIPREHHLKPLNQASNPNLHFHHTWVVGDAAGSNTNVVGAGAGSHHRSIGEPASSPPLKGTS